MIHPRKSLERALEEMAIVVDVVSHTPNTSRTVEWWAKVRDNICERNGITSLNAREATRIPRVLSAPELTDRVLVTLAMAADGHTVPTAAKALGVSAHTVKTHRARAMRALSAHTMTQAVATAIRLGLIEGERREESGGVVILDWSGGADAGRRRDGADGDGDPI